MKRGFTLIELLIAMAIVLMVSAIIANYVVSGGDGTVCRAGYKYVVTRYDTMELRQVFDAQGRGIPCEGQ